jgi:hypothetical protein
LNEAITLYSFFKGNKQSFSKINTDIRCKIQPIELFKPENHWCVERWWSTDEKEVLGIKDENLKLKIEEFPTLLDEVSNSIISIKAEVEELANDVNKPKFVKLAIKDIFDLKIKTNNSKFTKTFIDKNKGTIPVHSASKFPENVDYGYVKDKLEGVKYFEDCLTWNIDGSIGKVYLREGRFSLSEKVIPLILQKKHKDNLDLLFLKYAIEMEFSKHYFGFDNKAGKGKIQEIEISIPTDKTGNFDLNLQKQLAEKFKRIEEIKKSISDELEKISSTEIDFE